MILRHDALGFQVSIVDVSEKEGRTVCSGLQEEFTKKDVMFLQADVSLKEDLVRYTIPVATPLLSVGGVAYETSGICCRDGRTWF